MDRLQRNKDSHPIACACISCTARRLETNEDTQTLREREYIPDLEDEAGSKGLLGEVRQVLLGEARQLKVRRAYLDSKGSDGTSIRIGAIVDNLVFLLAIALFVFLAIPEELRARLIALLG